MTDNLQPPTSTIKDIMHPRYSPRLNTVNDNMSQEAPEYVFEAFNTAEEVSTLMLHWLLHWPSSMLTTRSTSPRAHLAPSHLDILVPASHASRGAGCPNLTNASTSPSRAFTNINASYPCLTNRDMHLGDFFWRPQCIQDGCLPAVSRGCSSGAIPDYSKWTVTSDWLDHSLQLHVSNVSQSKRGYTEVEERELSNEYQLDETYRFQEDSGDLRNPSEILISYLGQEKNRSNSPRYQRRG